MQIPTKLPKRRSPRPASNLRPTQPPVAREVPSPPDAGEPPPAGRAARRGGGPEDRAFYSCMCGYAFKAAVTTSVDCPHCGTEQAW